MVIEILIGTIVAGHAFKELAKDRTVRNKLHEWSEKCRKKAEELDRKNN